MQKELDKMERFANKIVDQSGIPSTAGQKLRKEVKVTVLSTVTACITLHIILF